MKARILALTAVLVSCLSCIETNTGIGGDLIPTGQTYTFHVVECPIENISMKMADSLSGFSSTRITVGAIRDGEFGLGTRSAAITMVPLFRETFDFGTNPEFKGFHFAVARDTTSQMTDDQARILQTIRVYELEKPIDSSEDFDCNKPLAHYDSNISKRAIVYNGSDSLSFNFTEEFGKRFLSITEEDLSDSKKYFEKFPGICIEADAPSGEGGRINIFDLQLDYNSDYQYIQGNYAKLYFSSEYDGERRDTSLLFYFGAYDFYDIDSLFTNSSTGSFPQYSLNLTSHETRELSGPATDRIYVEGGGGLKPVISARELKRLAEDAISQYGDPATAVINKASLVMPFEFPDDYKTMTQWPQILSPTCRITEDESTAFMGLTDSSSSDEDQGDINRSLLQYSPDITFHLQEILKIDEDDKSSSKTRKFDNGAYDIWFLIMANEVITTTTSGSSELSEMYNYLAYQSYYNDMYGGYGYGSYGYNNYYSNYYSYAMMAQYAASSTTSQSYSVQLDKDRYYRATLNGPQHPERRPVLQLVFALPNE